MVGFISSCHCETCLLEWSAWGTAAAWEHVRNECGECREGMEGSSVWAVRGGEHGCVLPAVQSGPQLVCLVLEQLYHLLLPVASSGHLFTVSH